MDTITATPGLRIKALSTHPYDQINLNNISQIIIWATVPSASSSILSSENETRWSPCALPSFTHLQALVLLDFGDDDNNCGAIIWFYILSLRRASVAFAQFKGTCYGKEAPYFPCHCYCHCLGQEPNVWQWCRSYSWNLQKSSSWQLCWSSLHNMMLIFIRNIFMTFMMI